MAKLAELKLGTLATRRFSFVRQVDSGEPQTIEVKIRVLSPLQLDEARVDAEQYVARLSTTELKGMTRDELLEDARVIELLSRAVIDPDVEPGRPAEVWAGPNVMRARLSPSEVAALHKAYEDHQDDMGPVVHKLTPETYEALLKTIAEEGSADPLLLLVSSTRKSFVVSTVLELWRLRMDKSSPGSASDEPSTTSESSGSADG